jgi:hypothetical protein
MKWTLPIVAIALASCSPIIWVKPGWTVEQRKRDIAECEYDASKVSYTVPGAVYGAMVHNDLMSQCLKLRGYHLQQMSWEEWKEISTNPPQAADPAK